VNLSLFNRRYTQFGGWLRTARLISIIAAVLSFKSCRNFRPILRITFTYRPTCFHAAFCLFIEERPIYGAGAVFRDTLNNGQSCYFLW